MYKLLTAKSTFRLALFAASSFCFLNSPLAVIGHNDAVRISVLNDGLSSIAKLSIDCGGVLIHSKIVLSAGHCTEFGSKDPSLINISFPNSSQSDKVSRVVKIKSVSKGIFETRYLDHSGQDLSLLLLEEPISFTPPIPLYSGSSAKLIGTEVIFGGYGRYQILDNKCYGGDSSQLNIAKLTVIDVLNEPGRWGAPLILGSDQVGICSGDSGSPALVIVNQKLQVLGIVSGPYSPLANGRQNGEIGVPFQFADVASASEFIKSALYELLL